MLSYPSFSNNIENFADDEEIDVKKLLSQCESKPYNLEKGLSFDVNSMHKYFKFDDAKS